MRPPYLDENEAFYADFWATTPHYTSRFPNGEEAARAGVILQYLSGLAEQRQWDKRPPRLLDAGCGRGWLTNLLSLYGAAEGCEPVAGAVRTARTLFPHLTFHALTAGELRQTPQFTPFDVVVSSEVIEHVPTDLQVMFLRELHDCLVPGGLAIVTTPRGELWATEGYTSGQRMENWLREAELEHLLQEAGFEPLALRRAVPVGNGLWHRVRRKLKRWRGARMERPSMLDCAIDTRRGLYQIWLARRQ